MAPRRYFTTSHPPSISSSLLDHQAPEPSQTSSLIQRFSKQVEISATSYPESVPSVAAALQISKRHHYASHQIQTRSRSPTSQGSAYPLEASCCPSHESPPRNAPDSEPHLLFEGPGPTLPSPSERHTYQTFHTHTQPFSPREQTF